MYGMAVTMPRQPYEMLHSVSDIDERHMEEEMSKDCEGSGGECVESLKRSRETCDVSLEDQGENQSSESMDGEPASKLFRASMAGGGKGGGVGGGGRRKQSKPLRMCNDAVLPADPLPRMEPVEKGEERLNEVEETESIRADVSSPADMRRIVGGKSDQTDDRNQSCALCDESFPTQAALEDHVRLVHDLRLSEEQEDEKCSSEMGEDAYPTKYHQLGRELHEVAVGALVPHEQEDSSEALNLKNPVPKRLDDDKDIDNGMIESEFSKRRTWDEECINRGIEKSVSDRNDEQTEGSLNLSFKGDNFCNGTYPKLENSELRYNKDGGSMDMDMMNSNGEPWDPNNKSRIFHPDAYCEICDREFCNKYFLKTHRANKHGIYDGSNGPPSTSSSSANTPNLPEQAPSVAGLGNNSVTPNGMFSIMSLLQQQQQQMQQQQQQLQQQHQQKDFGIGSSMLGLPFSRSSSALLTPKSAGLSGIPNPSSPVAAAAMASLCGTPGMSASSDYNAAHESNSGTPAGSKPIPADMEDYCEFCQKHFCNKYYLRKHKLDVHGVNTSAASQIEVKRHQPAAVQESSSQRSGTPMKTSGGGVTNASSNPYLRNMANLMLFNPFAAVVAAAAGNSEGSNFPSSALPPLLSGGLPGYPVSAAHGLGLPQRPIPSDMKKENCSTQETSTSTSSSSGVEGMPRVPPEVLQSLGILNAEAYMEMCRKEMLGGLVPGLLPSSDSSKKNIFSAANLLGFGSLSNLPSLPSIKREPMPEKMDSTEMFRNALFGMSPFGAKMEGSNNGLASELMHLDKLNSLGCLSNQGAYDKNIFGNMAAAKLVDRVVCDICNKEVCNKYFLKTHKIKVHGCDPNSLDTAGQERSPSKQHDGDNRSSHHSEQQQQQQQQQQQHGSEHILQQLMRESNSFNDRMRSDELSNKRIDPEAFCDICNKEFSSKYFLKTHRLNIHGIKPDLSAAESSLTESILGRAVSFGSMFGSYPSIDSFGGGGGGSLQTSSSVGLSRPSPMNGTPSVSSAHLNFLATSGLTLPGSGSVGMFGTQPSVQSDSSNSRDGSEKSRNSSRVTCRVCGKELCNKYFLRTHLAKCHGIASSASSDILRSSSGDLDEKAIRCVENGNDSNSRGACSDHSSEGDEGRPRSETGSMTDVRKSGDKNSVSNGYMPMNLAIGSRTHNIEDNHGSSRGTAKCWSSSDRNGGYLDDRIQQNSSMRCDGTSEGRSFSLSRSGTPVMNSASTDLRSSAEEHQHAADYDARYLSHKEHPAEVATKAAIANHIRNQQNRRMPVTCELCDERFSSQTECEDHIAREHSDRSGKELNGEGMDNGRRDPPESGNSETCGANSATLYCKASIEEETRLSSLPGGTSIPTDATDGREAVRLVAEKINGLAGKRDESNSEASFRKSSDTLGDFSRSMNCPDDIHKTRLDRDATVYSSSESYQNQVESKLNDDDDDSDDDDDDVKRNKSEQDKTRRKYNGASNSTSEGIYYGKPIGGLLPGMMMQTFRLSELESDDCENRNKNENTWQRTFATSLVCLPTLCPVTEPISVTFTLTPVSGPS